MFMKKKRIFSAAVLLLLTAVVMYAQELKFDGYFNSGLGIVYTTHADTDTFLKAFGVDSEQNGYRFRLNGSYTNEEENAGVKFRLQSQSRLDQGGYFSLPFVFGWMRFLNDVVYLAGGIVDDTAWQTADWWINDDAGEGLGALLKLAPVTGLNLGCGAYLISQQAAGSNNIFILNLGSVLPNYGSITPKIADAKYVFSVSYTMPDLFYLGASFRLKNKAGWNGTIDTDIYGYIYDGRQESSQLIGEFRFLGLENLTAVAAASLDNIQEFDTEGNVIISQTFMYELNRMTLGLNAAEFMYNRKNLFGKKIPYKPGLVFNLWGTYTISKFIPRLDLVYFFGGQSKAGGDGTFMWHRRGYVNYPVYKINTNDNRSRSVFGFRPSVRFDLTSGASVEIGDIFNYDFANYDGAYGDSGDPKKRSLISNVVYIDYKWTF